MMSKASTLEEYGSRPIVFLNPGAGPCSDYGGPCSARWAASNMRAFAKDVGGGCTVDYIAPDDCGRFSFWLRHRTRKVQVLMPGLSRARVRYMGEAGQNIWNFPRLYIDGHSLSWLYAVSATRDVLGVESVH
jgi:hypothetical protein